MAAKILNLGGAASAAEHPAGGSRGDPKIDKKSFEKVMAFLMALFLKMSAQGPKMMPNTSQNDVKMEP